MQYTVSRLAKISGISTRTLRYYDQIGFLKPSRISSNGYRVYGQEEVDRLQQILFYRELGLPLDAISKIVGSKDFDGTAALKGHLEALCEKRRQLDVLIENVQKTIKSKKGEIKMSDIEKFEGFKKQLIDENEKKYGKEIREKYSKETVEASNKKLMGTTKAQYEEIEALTKELNETLKAAFCQGDPAGELAQKVAELHKKWLCFYWDKYTKEAHIGLANMYVQDPRFKQYYDKIAPGCAEFLRDAIEVYCK